MLLRHQAIFFIKNSPCRTRSLSLIVFIGPVADSLARRNPPPPLFILEATDGGAAEDN